MATRVLIPILGEAITEATLSSWLKKEGDPVQRGETIAELETSKATLALESPANGILLKILVPEGTNLTIGQVVAIIGKPGEDWQAETTPSPSKEQTPAPDQTPALETKEFVRRISPAARRRAAELGIPLEEISALSTDKRITSEDVERYAASRSQPTNTENLPFRRIELSEIRRTIAQRMSTSQQIPQFSVSMEINADALLQAQSVLRPQAENITITVLLIYLVSQTLRKHPHLNAHYEQNAILLYDTVYLSLAVATPRGLIAPVIPEVEKMSLSQIANYANEITQRARSGTLLPGDLRDGTFTVSNLGMYGVSQFVPLLNPPQVAVLGIGAIQQRWIALPGGGGRPAQMLNLTITADHRALDGEQVALFLRDLAESIGTLQSEQIPI